MTKAEEFAQYMATAAEKYMDEVNSRDLARQDVEDREMNEGDLAQFEIDVADAYRSLRSAIYEFRKRMPK